VKEQPDDAEWDAGDIRYNVLRWTSSPIPPFGGYGPSFVNPRTGQILGADIMLELVSVSNRLRRERVFDLAGLDYMMEDEMGLGESGEGHADHHGHFCEAGMYAQQAMLFGATAMDLGDFTGLEKNDLIRQSLYRLVLHEVGHTLGLNHNFRGSNLRKLSEVHDKQLAEEANLCGSVMEYPSINFSPYKDKQGLFYDVAPGPYDDWVIDYGYSTALPDANMEEARLSKILAKSTDPDLAFANDADDMRSPGHGIDPRAMIYDLTDDPVGYAVQRLDLVNRLMPGIKTRYAVEGDSYHELRQAYLILTGEYGVQLRIVSRQVGGILVDRSFVGQVTDLKPFTPVSEDNQKEAMTLLGKYAFAPSAWEIPSNLIPFLQQQRRGFNHFAYNEDPKIHQRVL
ncbi:MAG: zinc-dependent metalloprotease, partial [Bacteroidota bacterium]